MKIGYTDETWQAVVKWAEGQIDNARKKNDNPALDPYQTAALRGRISAFKDLLALPKLKAAQAQQDEPQ